MIRMSVGPLAHLVERIHGMDEVTGSIPVWSTNVARKGYIAQLVRALRSHRRGLLFESGCVHETPKMNSPNQNRIFLIPGWLNGRGMYGQDFPVLEVWKERIDPKEKIEAEIIIAHSLGCNFALSGWKKNPGAKLILVNPLLPKRSLLTWFSKWREFHLKEKPPENKEIVKGIRNKIFGVRKCFELLTKDFDAILDQIPKENLVIICGEKDEFYCDEKFHQYIDAKKIRKVILPGIGHDWKWQLNEKIGEIIESWNQGIMKA
jgi:hypothetical protein